MITLKESFKVGDIVWIPESTWYYSPACWRILTIKSASIIVRSVKPHRSDREIRGYALDEIFLKRDDALNYCIKRDADYIEEAKRSIDELAKRIVRWESEKDRI
jgi:hypothetical protein